MTIQELSNHIAESQLSEGTKAKAAALLKDKTELTLDLLEKVKDLVREEIDSDFAALGIDMSEEPEAKQAQAEFDAEVDSIKDTMAQDAKFVEDQLTDIDKQRQELEDLAG